MKTCLTFSQEKSVEDSGGQKSKNLPPKSEKEQKLSESNKSTPASSISSRPAVILLDDNLSDLGKNTDLESSELTFGFEVNEQLLLSEEDEEEEEEETPTVSPDLSRFSNSPPSFNRAPPILEKHKFPPNFSYMAVHPGIPVPTMMVPAIPYMNCPIRFPVSYMMPPPQQPQQPLPLTVIEKCRNQSNSLHYIAPDESHVQKFNHDKIVSFVGLG